MNSKHFMGIILPIYDIYNRSNKIFRKSVMHQKVISLGNPGLSTQNKAIVALKEEFTIGLSDLLEFLDIKSSKQINSYFPLQVYNYTNDDSDDSGFLFDRVTKRHVITLANGERKIFYSKSYYDSDMSHERIKKIFKKEQEITAIAYTHGVGPHSSLVDIGRETLFISEDIGAVRMKQSDLDVEMARAIGNALARLHAAGVMHNDLVTYNEDQEAILKDDSCSHIYVKKDAKGVTAYMIDYGESKNKSYGHYKIEEIVDFEFEKMKQSIFNSSGKNRKVLKSFISGYKRAKNKRIFSWLRR